MNRKKGGPHISLLGRCGRKNTQLSSSTIASDPCACSCKSTLTYVNVTDPFSIQAKKLEKEKQAYHIDFSFEFSSNTFDCYIISKSCSMAFSVLIHSQ
ncbi:hypothetical protein HanRHA438_Chr17g0839501 [Helianthus annuus]|nr:hypothetical protein HanRHA438_Chr17g0839501 [Helianthus annuus]